MEKEVEFFPSKMEYIPTSPKMHPVPSALPLPHNTETPMTSSSNVTISNLQRQISEQINCSICLDRFDHPRILPCQHSFCLDCLQDVARENNPNTVDCPLCRREYDIPIPIGPTGKNMHKEIVN